MTRTVKVLIVDDSLFFREYVSRSLSADPCIQVVGVASDAGEAREKIASGSPDVVILDMEMPKMRGVDLIRQVLPHHPKSRFIVISSYAGNVFEAIQAGAVDFVAKPNAQTNVDNLTFINELISKVKVFGGASAQTAATQAAASRAPSPARTPPPAAPATASVNPRAVIAIGASTGGTEAILAILKDLPSNAPGIVVVQHMPPVFTKMYAERLDHSCSLQVREAVHGQRVEPGMVVLAQGDRHMRLQRDHRGYYVTCSMEEKVSGHRPSADVLFQSVAESAGPDAVGVILTGMGSDGAKGLLAMRKAGAYTIGQDQASCVVYGMPMVAYNIGGVAEQLPLGKIAPALMRSVAL